MASAENPRPQRLELGSLQVDLARETVAIDGVVGGLSPRAEALLLLLCRYPNLLVSREQILREVWADRVVEEAAVSHCIWQIRKAIGQQGKNVLQMRSKRGYLLAVPESAWIVHDESEPSSFEEHAVPGAPLAEMGEDTDIDTAADPDASPHELVESGVEASTVESKDIQTALNGGESAEIDPVGTESVAADSMSAGSKDVDSNDIESRSSDSKDSGLQSASPGNPEEPNQSPSQTPSPVVSIAVLNVQSNANTRGATPRKTIFTRRAAAAIVVALAAVVGIAGMFRPHPSGQFTLHPDAEMSIAVSVPEGFDWLRQAVQRKATEHAYLRGGEIMFFDRTQRASLFAGPHLQVEVIAQQQNNIVATLSLRQSGAVVRERYEGHADRLTQAVQKLLLRELAPVPVRPTPASDAFVSGLMAELNFDPQKALADYARALDRDPDMLDAKIATARVAFAQGRAHAGMALVDALRTGDDMSPMQHCRLDLIQVEAVPDRGLPPSSCPQAVAAAALQQRPARELLKSLASTRAASIGARRWLFEKRLESMAAARVLDPQQAETLIADAQRVAAAAGWSDARFSIGEARAQVASRNDDDPAAASHYAKAAADFESIGDEDSALRNRLAAIRVLPVLPGPQTGERRAELNALAARARRIGNVQHQIDALHMLYRLDRDRGNVWRSQEVDLSRMIAEAYLPEDEAWTKQRLMIEQRAQRRYADVLAGIASLEANKAMDSARIRQRNVGLRVESLFARDDIAAALAAVGAAERIGLQINDKGDLCMMAWLFVEAGQYQRSRTMLERCRSAGRERKTLPLRWYYGTIAQIRLEQRDGDPRRIAPQVHAQIDALLAVPDPARFEAESLALLARYAVGVPDIDRQRLQRARAITEAIAARDGAGYGLRTGAHLLRWRLCMDAARSDCGPVLPPWADQEALEARLARESGASPLPVR
jgi:DNA-binding winged helix-turn-helix (wHTH) protein/tetratricopeptide (TPR) repeat protein